MLILTNWHLYKLNTTDFYLSGNVSVVVSLGRLEYKGPEFETCSSVKFKYVLK